jgi:hypothetical protein
MKAADDSQLDLHLPRRRKAHTPTLTGLATEADKQILKDALREMPTAHARERKLQERDDERQDT